MFGSITTLRTGGKVTKRIPWMAFRLAPEDWQRVRDVCEILAVRHSFN